MNVYLNLLDPQTISSVAARLVPVTTKIPPKTETPPSPWLVFSGAATLNLFNLDTMEAREKLALLLADVPLYRINLELLVDKILTESAQDTARMKGVRAAFAPEEPPEASRDPLAEKYALAGTLRFPIIASRTDLQLLDLYFKLYGVAVPYHTTPCQHIAAIFGTYFDYFLAKADGFLWRESGRIRFDQMIYEATRLDHDPDITFESYVTRGRQAAEILAVSESHQLLAFWIQAERVQRELCRDIHSVLRLPDIRRMPRFIRADVFRILEREAMKQVFAEGIAAKLPEWPELRRSKILAEPISANARGEVAPLIQQLLNQTISADASYAGAAEAFVLQAERRFSEASKLLHS